MNEKTGIISTAIAIFVFVVFGLATQTVTVEANTTEQVSTNESGVVISVSDSFETECSFEASSDVVESGDNVTLSWRTSGFDTLLINDEEVFGDIGSKLITNLEENSTYLFEALKDDSVGSMCIQKVVINCEDPEPETPVRCEDFGYDFEIAKFEWEGNLYGKEYLKSDYSVLVSGDTSEVNWTASPSVDGVLVKASTIVEEFSGGNSGSVSKTQIGTGEHDISNIVFCGNDVPEYCELEVTKSVDKSTALEGEELTYTINVANVGNADCTGGGVRIFDVVDNNITYLSNTVTSNFDEGYYGSVYTESDRTLRFNGHTLNPGESGTITWKGIVNTPDNCGDFEVTNQAKATARELNNFQNWSYSQIVKTDISNSCFVEEPTCTLTPASQTIDYGSTATLTWATENATAVTITDFGSVALNDSDTTTPLTEDTSYTLTATGAGGEVQCYANVEVEREEPEVPECPLTAAEGRIIVDFEGLKLRTDLSSYYSQTDVVPMTVNSGLYDITLVSWDGYNGRVSTASQPNEQWQLQFMNDDYVVGESGIIGDLEDGLREVTKIEKVDNDYSLSSNANGLRAIQPFYPNVDSANSLYPICAAIDEKEIGMSTVIAHKIVCTDESELPNYGEGGPNIIANTAADWVATHDSCSFVEGWEFEWTEDQTTDPGDTLIGKAGFPWNSFGPTDANGEAITEINLDELTKDRVWFREVLQDGYIPFTHGQNAGTNVDNVSAEFYCDTDVLNYDNRDYISGLEADATYYCVAFNSPIPKVPVPSCDLFTANPSTITVGESSTLTWETSNVLETYLNNGIGAVSLNGTYTVSPLADITYVLTLIGEEDQTVDCEVPVMVSEDSVPVCEYFTATPDSLEVGGGDVELKWKVTDATEVSISPTVGTVNLTGIETVLVTEPTTYILTAIDDNGDETTCSAPVIVEDPDPFSCANNVSFNATPDSIKSGQNVLLEWSTTDVDSVSITHINLPGLSGTEEVSPSDDITYTLTATRGDESIECPVEVDVSSGGGGGSSSPRCELEISETSINRGDEITLTWDSNRATEVTLSDDLGNIIFTTDDFLASEKEDYFDGSIDLKPTQDTEYTLLVERGSKDRECTVEVEMEDDVIVLQTRDQQPLVAGISLSQVPYTGFEAGPFLTIMFYVLLAAWALYVAYYIVIQRKVATVPSLDEFVSVDVNSKEDVIVEAYTPSVVETDTTPMNLPVGGTAIGYANSADEDLNPRHASDEIVIELENRAHAEETLLSSDAIRYFIGNTTLEDRDDAIDKVIVQAKKLYPLEDGWVVINEERMKELCKKCEINTKVREEDSFSPTIIPEGTGSLAEAIVTGNVVAAYEMIGSRPMFSLADAAADLDAVYRLRRDEDVKVSDMLLEGTKNLSDKQIKDMITALTSALDGTYTDEASAVKMAIMKAIKASV